MLLLTVLEFVFWLIILPYLFFGLAFTSVADVLGDLFEPTLFLGAIWVAGMGLYLQFCIPSADAQFVSVVGAIADSHIAGIATPTVIFVIAGSLLVASVWRRSTKARAVRDI
jgi:hypothetical protein